MDQRALVLQGQSQHGLLDVALEGPHAALPASLLRPQTVEQAGVEQLAESLSVLHSSLLPDEKVESTNVRAPQELLYHGLPDEARPAGDEDGLLAVELLYLRHGEAKVNTDDGDCWW